MHLQGYIPREKMPAVYTQAHVFVLPSYNEGMSVATLEAMAAGLPVIVTKTPGTEDLVDDGVNGYLFDFGEIKVLVDQVEGLSNNRSLLKRMGQESRNYSMKHSWTKKEQLKRWIQHERRM